MRPQQNIIGNSPALLAALEQLSHLARIQRPILLVGERGTGKELAAQRLHFLSARWQAPLIKVNCAALADELLESELFGHEAGAFTGATRARRGRFERADGGTLFLDEVGTMSMRLQEKLLRLVEYGEFERLGGQETLQVNVRVIGATNIDLREQVAKGRFRADLLDRLSFDVVHLPALRQRPDDIIELAQYFAVQLCAELRWELFAGFTDAARTALLRHSWPGNVRELKNVVERSMFRCDDPQRPLDRIIIDPFLAPWADTLPLASNEQSPDEAVPSELPAILPADFRSEQAAEPTSRLAIEQPADFQRQVQQLEIKLLREALSKNGWNQRRTAMALGLSYDQIRGMVRKYTLSDDSPERASRRARK